MFTIQMNFLKMKKFRNTELKENIKQYVKEKAKQTEKDAMMPPATGAEEATAEETKTACLQSANQTP